MSDGLSDPVIALVAASPGALVVGKWLLDRFVSRADKVVEANEAATDMKLDKVLEKVTEIEKKMAVDTAQNAEQRGVVSKLWERINGGLKDHDDRLVLLETAKIQFAMRLDALEKRRRP